MRKIYIEVPTSRLTLTGTMLEASNPKEAAIIDDMWNWLSEERKCFVHPTMATGDLFNLFPRPPVEPPAFAGDQTSPMIDESPFLVTGKGRTEVTTGEITWNGWFPSLVAGPDLTEPLKSGGVKAATIDKDSLDDLAIVNQEMWHHNYLFHTLATVIISRKEN